MLKLRRDTRYSHDKSLYRDTMWLIFKRGKMHGTEVPGIYFEITCDGFNYGCGFYHASAAYMNTMRRLILQGDPAFEKAKKAFLSQKLFHMEGERYKRPHYPQRPEEERQWLEQRGISFVAESSDFNLLFSDRLSQKLEKDFRVLAPIYHFCCIPPRRSSNTGLIVRNYFKMCPEISIGKAYRVPGLCVLCDLYSQFVATGKIFMLNKIIGKTCE